MHEYVLMNPDADLLQRGAVPHTAGGLNALAGHIARHVDSAEQVRVGLEMTDGPVCRPGAGPIGLQHNGVGSSSDLLGALPGVSIGFVRPRSPGPGDYRGISDEWGAVMTPRVVELAGAARIELLETGDETFVGLGAVRIGDTDLRNGGRPMFLRVDTPEGIQYRRLVIDEVVEADGAVEVRLRAIGPTGGGRSIETSTARPCSRPRRGLSKSRAG